MLKSIGLFKRLAVEEAAVAIERSCDLCESLATLNTDFAVAITTK